MRRRPARPARSVAGYAAATTLALCGAGLVAGLDSLFVPAAVRLEAGVVLLAISARTAGRTWWRDRHRSRPSLS